MSKTARIQLTIQNVKDEAALATYLAAVRLELAKHGDVTMSPLRTTGSVDIAGEPARDRVEVGRVRYAGTDTVGTQRSAAREAARAARDARRADRAARRAAPLAAAPSPATTPVVTPSVGSSEAAATTTEPKA